MKEMIKSALSSTRFDELTQKFKQLKPILVLGDVGLDKYTYGEVKRISPEAPVPVLEVTKQWLTLGLAANIGHNLSSLGVKSDLCGVIGDDREADTLEGLVEDSGLKTWGLVRDESRPTILKERVITNTQQICRIDFESKVEMSASIEQKIGERVGEFIQSESALIIEDYAKGVINETLCQNLISKYGSSDFLIAVDPSRNASPYIYKGATLLKPNLIEAHLMVKALGFRPTDLESISDILITELKLAKLVITMGDKGMALRDANASDSSLKIIPTLANEVFDVSGAGDTSIALLVSGLLAGATLEEAAWLANCGAGVVVGKKGTAVVNLKELQQFHQKILVMEL